MHTKHTLHKAAFLVCAVSFQLAAQTGARTGRTIDSVGLRAFNAITNVVEGDLSMNTTLYELFMLAPDVRDIAFGGRRKIFEVPRRADGIRAIFTYIADSGEALNHWLSSRALPGQFDFRIYSDNVQVALNMRRAISAVTDELGTPDNCDRDTTIRQAAGAIDVQEKASYRRGNLQVMISGGINLRDITPPYRSFAERFFLIYRVTLATNALPQSADATRHDTPCFLTEAEFRRHSAPLDSAAYDSLRAVLLKRPSKVTPP